MPDGMNGVTVGCCWAWKSSSRFFFQNKIPFKFVKSGNSKKEFCGGQSPVNMTARHITIIFPQNFHYNSYNPITCNFVIISNQKFCYF